MKWRFHDVGWMVVLAATYFLARIYGMSFVGVSPGGPTVWPSSGLALAALLLRGYRLWPGIFVGALLAQISYFPLAMTLWLATGNTLQALAGAWLVNQFASGLQAFEKVRTVFRYFVFAAIVSTFISASFGVTSLCLGGYAQWKQYPEIWISWWLGHMASNLVVAPWLVMWLSRPRPRWRPKQILEGALMLSTIVLVGQIVFLERLSFESTDQLQYLFFPPLLWGAFRFGGCGATVAVFFTSWVALHGTLLGLGPFTISDQTQPQFNLETFMGIHMFIVIITVAILVLNAVITERRKLGEHLQLQNAVGRILMEAPSLAVAMPKILQVICEATHCVSKRYPCVRFCKRDFHHAEVRPIRERGETC